MLIKRLIFFFFPLFSFSIFAEERPSRTTKDQGRLPVFVNSGSSHEMSNFKAHLSYKSVNGNTLLFSSGHSIELPEGEHTLSVVYENHESGKFYIKASLNGSGHQVLAPFAKTKNLKRPKFDTDFTLWTKFQTTGSGTIFAHCAPSGPWTPGGKALLVRGQTLVYDIGWLGAIQGGTKLNDGKDKIVLLRSEKKKTELYLDGKLIGKRMSFWKVDPKDHVFKIAKGADNFATPLYNGKVIDLKYWSNALSYKLISEMNSGDLSPNKFPISDYTMNSGKIVNGISGRGFSGPAVTMKILNPEEIKFSKSWVQDLGKADHAREIVELDHFALERGKVMYESLCITCHGNEHIEGSLPTALKFHSGEFRNGSDPWSMFQTLDKGYGQMIAQPQYSIKDKYALIHYIRESLVRPNNPKQYFDVTEKYLALLPPKLSSFKEKVIERPVSGSKPYELMDFGPTLFWTYQVNEVQSSSQWNIAQKGIAVRLDRGAGGISKGKSWLIYDEDTMRVAAAYEGEFVDWRGIAFDGSHGTHTSIKGDAVLITPDKPAWRNPASGDWQDQRIIGRDGRRFGPLPRNWVKYLGLFQNGDRAVIHYRVGDREIHELPGYIEYGKGSVYTRTLHIGPGEDNLVSRLALGEKGLNFHLNGGNLASIFKEDGFTCLEIKSSKNSQLLTLGFSMSDQPTIASLLSKPVNPLTLTKGGTPRFAQRIITTEGLKGNEQDPFAVDVLTVPNKDQNPWNSWMRIGGFDFFADNPDRAAVCTWMGDVWLVDGVTGELKELRWRRICSGLFQPLGLKIVDGLIHVACRDQIARLHDLNGDLEIDWIECFNNDHQVTEHFHEFAMGLQTDDEGNFYYAKSARHAKEALVPHHGTLIRVSSDGEKTDIVATGFRAANGVCLNPDGTWIVTDQEGHWNPKNRINYVKEGGFYGNMMGYHDIADSSDSAMQQPLAWITNAFDRSPAELLWVPKNGNWGELNGKLLNLSYGYGMVYVVPHEVLHGQAQGGLCSFPIDRLPTGIHRGRFHLKSKDLFAAGMFAWAGNQREDGGFYRIRKMESPAYLPTQLEVRNKKLRIRFSDQLPPRGTFAVSTWSLKRTRNYGSKHYDTKNLKILGYKVSEDWLELEVPEIEPTWCMEIRCKFENGISRVIHNSIHNIK